MDEKIREFWENLRKNIPGFYAELYGRNKNRLFWLWGLSAAALIIGLFSGAASAQRYLPFSFVGARFSEMFLTHLLYFFVIYLTACHFSLGAAGAAVLLMTAFRLGACMSSLTALYGIGGFFRALFIYLPVNAVLIACLSCYLSVCFDCSRKSSPQLKKRCLYALKLSVYFIPIVFLTDVIAFAAAGL